MAYDVNISQLIKDVSADEPVFTALMDEVTRHLKSEFVAGRIQASQYAEVYLNGLQVTMEQAIQFLLQKDKVALEAELIQAQKDKINAEILLTQTEQARVEAAKDKILAEIPLVNGQLAKLTAETALINVQKDIAAVQLLIANKELVKADKEIERMTAEISLMAKQEILTQNQADKVLQEIDLLAQEVILTQNRAAQTLVQTDKITAEIAGIAAQTNVAIQQLQNMIKEAALIDNQISKITAEISLLNQKRVTEEAQTTGTAIGGYIGKQIALYDAQIQGFADDAAAKQAKIAADIYAVMRSTNDLEPGPLSSAEMSSLIKFL